MEPESIIDQCPECIVRNQDITEKKLFHCSFCDKWLCEKHLQPKPCYIINLGSPDSDPTKWQYMNDNGLGHPDASYTEKQNTIINHANNPFGRKKQPENDANKVIENKFLTFPTPTSSSRTTFSLKRGNSAKKGVIATTIIISLLAIVFFSGALSNFDIQDVAPSVISPPATAPIVINGRVVGITGESVTSGVYISILDSDGNEVLNNKTDATGCFSFSNMPRGSYTLQMTVPDGYVARSATSYSFSYSTDFEFKIQNLLVNSKTVNYRYTLRGVSSEISFTVYKGMYDYLVSLENSTVKSYIGQQPSPEDVTRILTLRYVNENVEKGELRNLVRAIQQITPNEDDQVRIAISLVQNIPYGGDF